MRKAFAILLLWIVALHTCSGVAAYTVFRLNQAAIEKTLCENRDRPERKCHGKCHLKKTLAKAEEQQQKLPVTESFSFFYFQQDQTEVPAEPAGTAHSSIPTTTEATVRVTASLFHPPC